MNRLSIVATAAVVVIVLAMGALILIPKQVADNDPRAELVCGNGTVLLLHLEIADSPEEQSRGLMNRSSLAPGAGMLFVFSNDAPRQFWMKNTLIPLDMIFIASDQTIIDIHENATPLSEAVITSAGPCRYVLEVNGGLCKAAGVKTGDRVRLDID